MRERLVSVRYTEPRAFQMFVTHRRAHPADHATPLTILEATGAMVEDLSLEIFKDQDSAARLSGVRPAHHYNAILRKIGRASDLVARSRESLVSLGRLVAFFRETHRDDPASRATVEHFATVSGDFAALSDYATFLSGKASFLLDATLGMISNEQNAIIKLVSVAALVFGPPTLIASIYGMNFEHMPELHLVYAYPLAVLSMVLSAIFPFAYFKRRGWL